MNDVTLYVARGGKAAESEFNRPVPKGFRKAACEHEWTVIERKRDTQLRHCAKCRMTSRAPLED